MSLPEGTRAEFIGEEIHMSPSAKTPHQMAAKRLYDRLSRFVEADDRGITFAAPFDVHLPSGDVVQPDIFFISREHRDIIKSDWVRGSPDLIVEVLSPEGVKRDRVTKHELYAKNGVNEYWIVDPQACTLEVFTLAGGRYDLHGRFEKDGFLRSPVLPEFNVLLAEIFRGFDE